MLQSLAERLEVAERAAQESDASQRVAQLEQDNQLLRDRVTAAQADADVQGVVRQKETSGDRFYVKFDST